MNDAALRELVRDAVMRHLGHDPANPSTDSGSKPFRSHPSHGLLPVAGGENGPCLIEPTVRCSHCGYCQSYGH